MKSLQQWLDEYAESHQNKTNKRIHLVCVPAIFYAVYLLLYCIDIPSKNILYNVANIVYFLCLSFWFRLEVKLGLYFLLIGILMTWITYQLERLLDEKVTSLFFTAVFVFTIGWIFQFIGHKIEGKKPSFAKDLQFLLIGPAWILHSLISRK